MQKRSLYLNERWDITLNGAGNIATTSGRYCDAQNVANAIRLFTKDAYLRQKKGVPHFIVDLGVKPSFSEVRSEYRRAAKEVENIRDAVVENLEIDTETRTMTGIIIATTEDGNKVTIEI